MKQTLAIVLSFLFGATLLAVAILLAQVIESIVIVLAIVVLLAVFGIGAGLLIATNTRPRWPDPYGQSTDELLRPPLYVGEDRRTTPGTVADRSLTERISDLMEDEAAKRPMSSVTPPWFVTERHDDADDTFKDGDE